MRRTCLLNKDQIKEFNKDYNVEFYSVMIQQLENKFFAILDCDLKVKLYPKEALKYFL